MNPSLLSSNQKKNLISFLLLLSLIGSLLLSLAESFAYKLTISNPFPEKYFSFYVAAIALIGFLLLDTSNELLNVKIFIS